MLEVSSMTEMDLGAVTRDRDQWRNRALAAEFSIHSGDTAGGSRDTLLLRGEWLRAPELRNEYALLEARSGAVSILLDRQALVMALRALDKR